MNFKFYTHYTISRPSDVMWRRQLTPVINSLKLHNLFFSLNIWFFNNDEL